MTFQDFLERAAAVTDRDLGSREPGPLSRSRVFHMGDDAAIEEAAREVWTDILGEIETRVHLPFSDTTCVSRVPRPEGEPGWVLDRLVEIPVTESEKATVDQVALEPGVDPFVFQKFKERTPQKFAVIRFEEDADHLTPWIVLYWGTFRGHMGLLAAPSRFMETLYGVGQFGDPEEKFFQHESKAVLKQAALISHPSQYVVRVTPALSPKEARRVEAGRPRPARKSPHFIVVDHTVLTNLRPHQGGTHARPVPHQRRGHWKRLAARCRHARLLGKEKVWVRPAYVGERTFTVEHNFYEVLLDFNPRKATVEAP